MKQGTIARIVSVVVMVAAAAVAATTDQLYEMGAAVVAGAIASIGIWMMPPTDMGDWTKLRDHLTLSVPLALLSVVTGVITLMPEGGFDLAAFMALVLALLVPASVLEARLNQG